MEESVMNNQAANPLRLGPARILKSATRSGLASFCATFLLAAAAASSALAADFPGAGHKFIADFKKFRFEHAYPTSSSLTWTTLNPDGARGQSETVAIHAQEIADKVFMVSWQEGNKATVVQIQDYAKNIIFTNLTLPNGTFIQLQGTFVPAD
jgi:hypothetical protein